MWGHMCLSLWRAMQVLLTSIDLWHESERQSLRVTINSLLSRKVVPILNGTYDVLSYLPLDQLIIKGGLENVSYLQLGN